MQELIPIAIAISIAFLRTISEWNQLSFLYQLSEIILPTILPAFKTQLSYLHHHIGLFVISWELSPT